MSNIYLKSECGCLRYPQREFEALRREFRQTCDNGDFWSWLSERLGVGVFGVYQFNGDF